MQLLMQKIKKEEYEEYLSDSKDFINDKEIWNKIYNNKHPTKKEVLDIITFSIGILLSLQIF